MVPIQLDKARNLHYTINAVCDLEDAAGKTVMQILPTKDNPSAISFTNIRLLLWAGLIHEAEELTPKGCGIIFQEALQNGQTLQGIMEKITTAFTDAGLFGKEEEEGGKKEGEKKQ